ncbi:MAG: carboxypeptidase regulatory-like domain-containing protein, partial [Candidatus Aureabacteria bacterium]|nr:carboxypeptidase regulatory-like domain-containing protein [Candidatus Auribacterota bacterium]
MFFLTFSIQSQEEESNIPIIPTTLTLEYHKEARVPLQNYKRHLLMNPNVASVSRAENFLIVRGENIGETSLIIWLDRRYSIIVKVITPPVQISNQQKMLERKRMEATAVIFQIDYSFGRTAIGEEYSELEEDSKSQNAKFTMESPFIKNTRIGLNGEWLDVSARDANFELFSGYISNIRWPESQTYRIDVGSVSSFGGNYSNPGAFQGISLYPLRLGQTKSFSLGLCMGRLEEDKNRYWSGTFYAPGSVQTSWYTSSLLIPEIDKRDFLKIRTRYSKGRSTIWGMQHIWIFDWLNFFQSSDDPKNESGSLKSFYDLNLKLSDRKQNYEIMLGGAMEETPYYSVTYSRMLGNLHMKISRQEVTDNTHSIRQTLVGSARNELSLLYSKIWTVHKWLKSFKTGWTITDQSQNILSSFSRDTENRVLVNQLFAESVIKDNRIRLFTNQTDASDNVNNPYQKLDYGIQIYKPFVFLIQGNLGLSYTHSSMERTTNETLTSDLTYLGGSLNLNLFKYLSYGLNISQNTDEEQERDSKTQSVTQTHSLYSYYPFSEKISASLGYSYSLSNTDTQYLFTSNEAQSHHISSSVAARLNDSSSCRVNYMVTLQEQTDDTRQVRSQLSATFSSRFYTLFGWKPKTEISVIAFIDINGSGTYEEEIDKPVPDLPIFLNNKDIGHTNPRGKLFLGKIRGFKKTVSTEMPSFLEGYIFSTQSKYELHVSGHGTETCLFGFALNTSVSGTVYNNVNRNDELDEEDEFLPNVFVTLSNGMSARTDLRGRFYFSPVPEGDFELAVDSFSLPEGYISAEALKRTISISKGSSIRSDFCLNAMRILKGQIMVIQKRRPVPFKGLLLNLAGQKKVTSEKGG